jgi:hypothetical protein
MSTHTGGTAQEVGGPFDKEGSIGKQFTTEGAIGACDVWGVRWRTAAACVRPHLPERHSAAHVANQAALRVRSHVAAASHSRRPVPCASPHLCLAGALQRNRQAGAAAHRPGRGVPVALLLSLRSMRPVSAALPVAWSPCQCTARAAAPSLAAHAAALCALPLSPHAAASGSQAALCRRQPRRLMPRGRTCRRPRSRSRAKRCVFLGGGGGGFDRGSQLRHQQAADHTSLPLHMLHVARGASTTQPHTLPRHHTHAGDEGGHTRHEQGQDVDRQHSSTRAGVARLTSRHTALLLA